MNKIETKGRKKLGVNLEWSRVQHTTVPATLHLTQNYEFFLSVPFPLIETYLFV